MQESVAFRCHDCSPDVLLKFLPPRKDGRYPVDDTKAWLSPEWRWIPGYLETHGDVLTDYGRNWLNQKLQEGKDEAYQQALDACQSDLAAPAPPESTTGVSLKVSTRLSGNGSTSGGEGQKRAARLSVPFSPQTESVARVPLSVFWIGANATYDLNALNQAVQPVSGLYNANHPLSLRDVQLSSDGVVGAVVFQGHEFLPIPAGVETQDDLRVEREAISFRLDFATEWADGGALDNWSVPINVSLPETQVAARFDFNGYYVNGSWLVPPPPAFDWNALAVGCLEDVLVRALPNATTRVEVRSGTDDLVGEVILSTTSAGWNTEWPLIARHRLFHSTVNPPHQTSAEISVGPSDLNAPVEVLVFLPACLAGLVEIDPANVLYFGFLYADDGSTVAEAVEWFAEDTLTVRLHRKANFYHWDRNVDIRLNISGGYDIAHSATNSWLDFIVLRVPLSWNGAGDFVPADSEARAVVESWSTAVYYPAPGGWMHTLGLKFLDYADPLGVLTVSGSVRVTWPDGYQETKGLYNSTTGGIDGTLYFQRVLASNAAPTVQVRMELTYEGTNRRRRMDGSGFDYLAIPGNPAIRNQTLTP